MQFFLVACSLLISTNAHSWLECAKYGNANADPPLNGKTYDINNCAAFPRAFEQTFGPKASHVFGIDRGFNVQPGTSFCNNRPKTYTTDYPKATYTLGEKVRLVWPAKNHDAEVCTNPFIPDTAMKIYATPTSNGINGPSSLTSWTLVADFKQNQIGTSPGKTGPEGFQRCPDFCGTRGTDKAICFQDMLVDTNILSAGDWTFLWYWIFNQGSPAYTTCWDATIVSNGGGGGQTTTAPPQTTRQTTSTTQSGGGGGGTGQMSLELRLTNSGGNFDQLSLSQTIASQMGVQACAVTTVAFSGSVNNGQPNFNAFFAVNVATSRVSTQITLIGSNGFKNAIQSATGGTTTVTPPTSGGIPVTDSCSSTTTTTISRYTISMVLTVTLSPLPSPGALASAIDSAVTATGVQTDVSCVSAQTSGSFNCALVVFSVPDVISVSNMASQNPQSLTASIAASFVATGTAASAAQFGLASVPQNIGNQTEVAAVSPGAGSTGSLTVGGAVGIGIGTGLALGCCLGAVLVYCICVPSKSENPNYALMTE